MSDTVSIKGQIFPAKIAVTELEQRQGLMWQKWPPPIMVFPYKTAGYHRFWMKNTYSPLDIIFCNANKVIAICKGEPLSTTLIGPQQPSDLVIELPAGTAKSLDLRIGDYVGYFPTKKTQERQRFSF